MDFPLVSIVIFLSILFSRSTKVTADSLGSRISHDQLRDWAKKFGGPMFEFGKSVTKYNELLGRFQNNINYKIEPVGLQELAQENLYPFLNQQYFCSSDGILSQFPTNLNNDSVADCRTDHFYLQRANGPKNIVVLLDVSESMTQARNKILHHVTDIILNTLTKEDLAAVFTFSDQVKSVSGCFNDSLVQSHPRYVKEIKRALGQTEVIGHGNANFPLALSQAFDLFENRTKTSECGEQNVILVVTATSEFNYKKVFEQRQTNLTENSVQILSYVISEGDITDKIRSLCRNPGKFVHISTKSTQIQIQEKVLMSFPLTTRRFVNEEIHWSSVSVSVMAHDNAFISASVSVYDKRNSTKFLGVAWTRIDLEELMRFTTPFDLGVNGYAFLLYENGQVVFHPAWKPLYERSLRPGYSYNTVEMGELEIPSDDKDNLSLLQDQILHQGQLHTTRVKIPQDNFKRVAIRSHTYLVSPIELKGKDKKSPYSLVLVIPEGMNKYHGEIDILRLKIDHGLQANASDF